MCAKTLYIYLFKRTFHFMHKWSNLRTLSLTAMKLDRCRCASCDRRRWLRWILLQIRGQWRSEL